VAAVPVRRRDMRLKGCTGDSQLVIGNAELEGLIVEVLEAAGAPADVRTIRVLVMSRLPLLDVRLTQFGTRVDEFLSRLGEEVRGKSKQYERILSVLRLCYLSPEHSTQLEVASRLGVSDSLVSDYRRRIERALHSLSLSSVEEAAASRRRYCYG